MRRAEDCMPSPMKFTSEIYIAWTTFLGSTTTASHGPRCDVWLKQRIARIACMHRSSPQRSLFVRGKLAWRVRVSFWPIVRAVSFVDMHQRAYTIHRMEDLLRQNPSLVGRKNPAKFEIDCISRNGRRMIITHPNLIILVSFFSAEDALSNDVKKYNTFRTQSTENLPFRFFGTPGISKQPEDQRL